MVQKYRGRSPAVHLFATLFTAQDVRDRLATEDVESQLSFPVESALSGLQDVTRLRQFIDLYSCRLGLPASVKYDPHNPGDSIVISESWSGLRKPTIVLPQRPVAKSGTLV